MSDWRVVDDAAKQCRDGLWWVVPKTADETIMDTSGRPIVAVGSRLLRGAYGCWSVLMKPTHWMPIPAPPEPAQGNSIGGVCRHGSFRRHCETCDLAEQLDAAEQRCAALEANRTSWQRYNNARSDFISVIQARLQTHLSSATTWQEAIHERLDAMLAQADTAEAEKAETARLRAALPALVDAVTEREAFEQARDALKREGAQK